MTGERDPLDEAEATRGDRSVAEGQREHVRGDAVSEAKAALEWRGDTDEKLRSLDPWTFAKVTRIEEALRSLLAKLEQAERQIAEARDEVPQELLDAAAKQVERAEQAERERDEARESRDAALAVRATIQGVVRRAEEAEARLAKVPALVNALKEIREAQFIAPEGLDGKPAREYAAWMSDRAHEALAAWEQE